MQGELACDREWVACARSGVAAVAEAEAGGLRPFLSGSWAGVNCGDGGRGRGGGAHGS
eukprot:COSAG01_NODE_3298_length_6297_cov_68.182317_10_plen_58_part_00